MRHPTNHIFQHTPESLAQWCKERGMPAFRATQVLDWVYAKGVADPALMSNLGKGDRDLLRAEMTFVSGRTLAHQVATDGTQKLLVEWSDGDPAAGEGAQPEAAPGARLLPILNDHAGGDPVRQTECVMIPSPGGPAVRAGRGALGSDSRATTEGALGSDSRATTGSRATRKTACISSQVGCPVGCRFCASGLGGLDANLSAGRIVEQVWRLSRLPGVGRITNVVFMGMGEPLANFAPVKHAIGTITAPWGLGISARKVTVSTVGLPRAIERLAREVDAPVTLALSLHATSDEVRRDLIPWSHYTTIDELIAACDLWFQKTGREITLEYTLLRGVNDRPEHAHELARIAKRIRANVNLIRFNEVGGLPFQRPATEDVRVFQEVLRGKGVNAHIRASRGRDIAAACGQLRHEAAQA